MNVFRSAHTIDRYFPESSATDLDINPDGTSNSGKAGKSVRMHERVALAPVNEIEKETFLRVYSGDQLYNHPDTISPLDGTELFGDDTAVHWDYGCGRGEYIVDLASRNPDKKYVGVDLHYRSLLLGVRMAADAQLNNVRFIRADAKLLSPFIPDQRSDSASVHFPAPLPSKQGAFYGMPDPQLASNIHRTLEAKNAPFEFASDSEPYFRFRMRELGFQGLFNCDLSEISAGLGETTTPTRYQRVWESKGIKTHRAILRKKD